MQHRDFHENGYRIFGLCGSHDSDGKELGQKEAFKKPRASNWQHTPHWSDDQLEVIEETGQVETGYGVLCRGLIVIDVDARNSGVTSWHQLAQDIPAISGAGLVVQTGSGGGSKHLYFKAPEGVALVQNLPQYPGIDFKSSGFVVGPGSLHSSGARYAAVVGSPDDIGDAPEDLVTLLVKPERHRAEHNGSFVDFSIGDLSDMLSHIPNNDADYELFLRIGMALHQATNGTGFDLWDDWAQKSSKYVSGVTEYKWHSFGKSANPVTIGTLIHYAEENGWQQSVEFTSQADFTDTPPANLLDTSSVDLLRPPGFVGEVKKWIDGNCRYPREQLATAGAILAVGNVIGLRYTDDLDGVTANMFVFAVADSSTGKEAVLQAVTQVMVKAGLSGAVHGALKSQQEVTRNLIRHQPAFYLVDEMGIELQKVSSAQKRGGAAYLEGLIGSLMSFYSKANSTALIGGDVKEELRAALIREASAQHKIVEGNEDKSGRAQRKLDRLQRQVADLDNGIDRPFLSLMGFTTPITFDGLVDAEQATNGFIGRSLLVRERESNPRPKRPFKPTPMPESMERTLWTLYDGGAYAPGERDRLEHPSERIKISTAKDAVQALYDAQDWFMDYAEQQKERSGLEPVVRRGYELLAKVSLILAAPSGIRTLEHVQWAFALVKRDIEEKMRLVVSNDQSHGADKSLMAKITSVIDKEHGETFGVIRNRLRRFKPDDIKKALDKMAEAGMVRIDTNDHPANKRTVERYFFTG